MTTKNDVHACECGGPFEILDSRGHGYTGLCRTCKRASLVIDDPQYKLNIRLADFHLKRGEGPERRPLDDLVMAARLVECLCDNRAPSPATRVDFGIDDTLHFKALQHAVKLHVAAYDLDRVMGDGPAITRLVQSVPGQPFVAVEFRTAYDGMALYAEDYDES